MTSYVRNISTRNYHNLIILVRDIIDIVGNPFLSNSVYLPLDHFA